jgi:hypothetical protein
VTDMIDQLALSAEQTAIIRSGVEGVPPRWRTRFLTIVADSLMPNVYPTNRQVIQAVNVARRALAIGISPPCTG